MRTSIRALLLPLFLSLGVLPRVQADAVVLVPGYLSYGHDWRAAGVAGALVAAGWEDGGNLLPAPGAPRADIPPRGGVNRFYTVELPSEAPLPIQEGYLAADVAFVRATHPGEPLWLVGHSAGGVLARLFMVRNPGAGVAGLITVATPHAGTEAAEWGNAIGDSPLGWITPLVGLDTINRSQGLYYDLNQPYPGTLLSWLNFAPHPQAYYASVIHLGDDWVEPWSQDLNGVPALQGRAATVTIPGDHGLHPGDGAVIARLLYEAKGR